ncbi:MAG: hypothetical protein COV59_02755 [Candidatus Magasanikbacteria bacterium CG11_big_fil_rev_8_21_14_0_20_39_34]|uniref:Acriflavin resistance protein n=1 Tax=Candidatus Magasanikbacteria bacterium CG11_big_fil_rev_8_21_14_0_20_39_34 TaxID=1974653 RepID=A0A2H0N598_9BACT|nr:MAG: hypothetical protein COV59_02755 [Candidatus Magasanikbacteria bacterium CG11_big_fil_rev_8_21_14_0_20_39_34]
MIHMDQNKKSKFWEFFLENYQFTYVLLLSIVVLGIISIVTLPKESSPEIEVPIGIITTPYPGANAEDVEELVTNPIEDRLSGLEDLDTFSSVSKNGISSITVQFNIDSDPDKKIADLKEKVDEAKVDLPEDAEDPIVKQISVTDDSILTFALSGPYDANQLKDYAEDLKDEIEQVSGVNKVNIIGGQDREFQVIVNKAKLDSFGASIQDVTNSVRASNSDIPAGIVQSGSSNYTVRFAGRVKDINDLKSVPIKQANGTAILLSDVGEVVDGYSRASTLSRLSIDGGEPRPSITILVFKNPGGNIIKTVKAVEEKIQSAKGRIFPENVEMATILNNADRIKLDLTNLTRSGIQTIIIIFLLLYFFLGFKEAVLAGLSIPLTFFIGFFILSGLGYTLNFLTLFSLILSLGVLVDSAIVITEGIYVYLQKGMDAKKASRYAIREFKLPLITGILTTVFAFLPMMLSSGIIGKFIETIPITVTSVLFASLFVALGLVTTLASRFLRNDEDHPAHVPKEHKGKIAQIFAKAKSIQSNKKTKIEHLYNWYASTLNVFLNSAKKRKQLKWALILGFFMSVALVPLHLVQVNMFPSSDFEIFYVDFEKPVGTPLLTTSGSILDIEKILEQDKRIASFVVNVGSGSGDGSVSQTTELGSTHLGHFIVKLKDERKEKSYDIVDSFDEMLKNYPSAKIRVWQQSGGPPSAAPVEVSITGESLDTLDDVAREFESLIKTIPNTKNVQTNVEDSPGEFVLGIDRIKAQLYGVSTVQIAQTLHNAISGTKATVVRKDGKDIDVLVKYDFSNGSESDPTQNLISLDAIGALTIATPQGDIPLMNFTSSHLEANRSEIPHKDGERIAKVSSETTGGVPAQAIFQEIEKNMSSIEIPDGYTVTLGGEREDINESFSDMFRAMFLAIFLIAALLVWQFKSFRQPLFILTTIPLSLIGVLPGLFLMGFPLSFPGVIGVVALAGIVVNNAIILIDRINQNRNEGMSKLDAVREAAKTRLQPILLTTITTIAGIFPLVFTNDMWGPLAYSIIFGLLFSTVSSLLVIPLLYQHYGEENLNS